jgi:DNA-binding response OmpR family regulator
MAHILCVDDDVAALELRRAILERAGHQVDVQTSVPQAIEKVMSRAYDAVVTDWRLGGHTARGLIQAAKVNPQMPVVVISGFVAEAFQSAEPLANLYLDKPVNPSELMEILDVLLRERGKQGGGPPAAAHR